MTGMAATEKNLPSKSVNASPRHANFEYRYLHISLDAVLFGQLLQLCIFQRIQIIWNWRHSRYLFVKCKHKHPLKTKTNRAHCVNVIGQWMRKCSQSNSSVRKINIAMNNIMENNGSRHSVFFQFLWYSLLYFLNKILEFCVNLSSIPFMYKIYCTHEC